MFDDAGSGRPDPATADDLLLTNTHAFELSGGIEQIAANASFAGLAQDFPGGARTIGERGAQQLGSLPLALAIPYDACDMAARCSLEAERQRRRGAAQVVFGRGQDAAL